MFDRDVHDITDDTEWPTPQRATLADPWAGNPGPPVPPPAQLRDDASGHWAMTVSDSGRWVPEGSDT